MKKGILLFLIVLTAIIPISRQAQAVPAYPHPITVPQSDGTQITIRIVGDEFSHYTLSSEGYTIVNDVRGDYYYARLANDGNLTATAVRARPIARLTPAERQEVQSIGKALKPTAVSKLRMQAPAQAPGNSPILLSSVAGMTPPGRISSARTTGKLKSLVILVETSDVNFTVPNPQQAFTALLTQDGYSANGATGSAWNFYHENSNGQFDPEFVVVGPYKASKTMSYYAGKGGSVNVAELVVEACQAASNAGVNFSQYADNGIIRDVFIFFAGHNQAEGAGEYKIWPHRYDVRGEGFYKSFNGVQLQGYACSSEYRGASSTTMAGIGTFCHEFGHVLGWPDFYDTDYQGSGGNAPALENYSTMCSGSYNNAGRTPPAINILERWMMGWATPEELKPWNSYTMQPITSDKGYLIPSGRNNDYFLIEYRGAGKTAWDNPAYIGNVQGMMVYHVDYTTPRLWLSSNNLNSNPSHECMKLVRSVPGATDNPSRTIYPGSSNVTLLSADSNNDYKSWTNLSPNVVLRNISVNTNNFVSFTTTGNVPIPDLQFKADTYQRDAVVSWIDTKATSWVLSWEAQTGGSPNTSTVTKPELHISGLSPQTTYKVTITPKPDNEDNPAQTFTFTTQGNSTSDYPTISLSEYEYTLGRPILLAINAAKDLVSIKWYINGQLTSETFRSLPAGEHKIIAEVTADDGSTEYIIKYILVK